MSDQEQLSLFKDDSLSHNSPLRDGVDPFLDYLRGEGKSHHTIKNFRSDLNLLASFLGDDIRLGKITTKRLNEFLEWLEFGRGVPCSRKSYARRVTTLKVFFKWLAEIKIQPNNPALDILQRSGPAPLQSILSERDVEQLLDFGNQLRTKEKPDARPYLLFKLLLETGMKKSETANLLQDHIEKRDTDKPTIIVRYKRQNIFKERRLPISHEWLEVLDEYLAQYRPKENTIFDCTPRNLEYVLNDLAKAAGISNKVSFDIMRWTSAVHDYRSGMDMDMLRQKMGLSEISWRETSQKIVKLAQLNAERSS